MFSPLAAAALTGAESAPATAGVVPALVPAIYRSQRDGGMERVG